MAPKIVKDMFSTKFKSVNQNDMLSACLSVFKEDPTPVLIVLNDKGKYVGVIAHSWIIRSRYDPSTTKVETLTRPAPTVSPEDSLSKAARLMLTSRIYQLPVFTNGKLVGTVTADAIIKGAVMGQWGNTKVENVMTQRPHVVEQDESVGAVLSLFREHGISHAPVVKDGTLVGLVSIQDIVTSVFQPRQRQTVGDIVGEKVPVLSVPVKGIMSKPVVTVLPETMLKDAVDKMLKTDVSSLVVIKRGRPAGILTKRDLLEPIAGMELPKQRITVQFAVKNIEIDDIQRGMIMEDFESFARRYRKTIQTGALFVYMKTHGTNFKGMPLIHCRLQFRTDKGTFYSSSEGYGAETTFKVVLERLERQMLRNKELAHEPECARRILRQLEFPPPEQ